jgi:tetratricopeptide (TPR) repeat protein
MSGEDVLSPAWDVLPSDLAAFRVAMRDGSLQRALALEERGFASRLKRIPGEEYDDWLVARRARLRRELREAAARAWDTHQPDGAWRLARDAAEVLHVLDPDSQSALRNVVEARAMCGGFEAAEAAFAAFIDGIDGGAALEPETRALVERVRRLSGEREIGPPRDVSNAPPLVGRQEHLRTARAVLEGVRVGGFHFLVVQGDSGVGKTRLLDETRREAHIKGFRCLQARSAELERHIPLNPLIDAFGHPDVGRHLRDLDDPWRAVIAALLPHLPDGMQRPSVPPIAESSLSRRLYDAFAMLFARLAEDEPTILFLDDLQWADATTIAVLQFVQRRWRTGSMAVIATIRPDVVGDSDGVARYLGEDDDLPVTRIELHELEEADAMRLVALVANDTLDDSATLRLYRSAGGNPFYLVELTKDYLAGHLRLPELPSDTLMVPISLRQLVEPRLEALGNGASRAASFLAISGRWMRLSDLAALTHTDARDCIADVEELERKRLVVVDRDQVRIAHELLRGALYHRLGETRRALLHREVAEHLLSLDQPQPGELAIHFGRAGDGARAARFGREAADAALENGAMAEAAHFLQVVTENEENEGLRAEATADLARVLHMKRDIARADPLLELAASRLRAVGNPGRAIRVEILRIEDLAEVGSAPLGQLFDELARIKVACRRASDDEAWALVLDCELRLLHKAGDAAAIQRLFSELRLCAGSADPRAACSAKASLALEVLYGDGDEALLSAREAVEIAKEHGPAEALLKAQNRLFVVLMHRGLATSDEGRELYWAARSLADKIGDVGLKFFLESNRAVVEMDAGDLAAAARCLERAEAILDRAEGAYLWVSHYFNRGELAFSNHDFASALEWFRLAENSVGSAEMPEGVSQLLSAGIGLCALELGNLGEARRRAPEVSVLPKEWRADPYILLAFASRLLERRGRRVEAYAMVGEAADRLRPRFPVAWLKALALESRLGKRIGGAEWSRKLEEGLATAEELRLPARAAELRTILGRREGRLPSDSPR